MCVCLCISDTPIKVHEDANKTQLGKTLIEIAKE